MVCLILPWNDSPVVEVFLGRTIEDILSDDFIVGSKRGYDESRMREISIREAESLPLPLLSDAISCIKSGTSKSFLVGTIELH